MLNQDYKDMLSLLLENEVDFLLVGAYALSAHGFPRATGDIDIFVRPSKENAKHVFKTLTEFGAPLENIPFLILKRTEYFESNCDRKAKIFRNILQGRSCFLLLLLYLSGLTGLC